VASSSETSSSPSGSVAGVVVTRQLPRTGIDPGLLLMLGGMLMVSGVLMLRYSDSKAVIQS
jgi:LPXTG-motif cell wall-anchored protein